MYDSPSVDKCEHILAAADREIEKITGEVAGCLIHPPSRSFITSFLYRLLYPRFIRTVHEKDRKFTVGPQCTSCGICVAVCPADNIRIVDTTPVWNHHCELCCGCIHHCPVQAIEAGKKTAGRSRYINPGVSLRELFHRDVSPGKPR
jgi:ferredoxin